VGIVAVLSSGCANVIGLSELEEVPCVGKNCDASTAADSATGETLLDSSMSDTSTESSSETSIDDSAMMEVEVDGDLDSGTDTGVTATDVGADTTMDSTVDSIVDSTVDSGVDSGADTKTDSGADTKTDTGVVTDTMIPDSCTVACDTVTTTGAICMGATCAYSGCKAGFANCDTTAPDTNGCETNTTTTLNCGGCGNVCSLTNASTASCSAGLCSYSCKTGFGDCDKTGGNTNGCETSLSTTLNCSACGAKCDTTKSIGAGCSGATCTYSGCAAGFADCNTTAPNTDGCESPVDTDVANCGGCGRGCSSTNVATKTCAGSVCTSTCNAGFSNCNKPAAPGADDGCECATPECCGTACANTHKNCVGTACASVSPAMGQNYFIAGDGCRALGTPGDASTYTGAMATAARAAWPGSSGATLGGGTCFTTDSAVSAKTSAGCAVWIYSGTNAGYVKWNTAMGGACLCPTSADMSWN
jgi:hypothetical protein